MFGNIRNKACERYSVEVYRYHVIGGEQGSGPLMIKKSDGNTVNTVRAARAVVGHPCRISGGHDVMLKRQEFTTDALSGGGPRCQD